MAEANYICWARDRVLRGVGNHGLIHIAPENATTYRTLSGLVDRGMMEDGFKADGDVGWTLTPKGRYAMQQLPRNTNIRARSGI